MSLTKNTLYYRTIHRSGFFLRRGNIVDEEMDAIVSAANSRLVGGGGVDAALREFELLV